MSFASVTAIVETAPGRFKADVDPAWTIGGKPNGGYLLAILGRAVTSVGSHPHVIAASAHYLAPPDPGAVEVVVEVLRAGRSASQLRARMMQAGAPCVEALFTTSTLGESEPVWAGGEPACPVAPFDECVRLPGASPTGIRVAIMDVVQVRLDPAVLGFARGEPSGTGELRGWLAMPGEDFDPLALLYAVDAYPPATFEVAPSGWVPTLELTAYVRALPAPGPVRVLQRAQLIEADRVDEACFVWDSAGRLVAQATQLAGIRLQSPVRNT
jgi:acyl-Coa thioesterase superfamily protein/acyl-CoA thioesterase superfamily protein